MTSAPLWRRARARAARTVRGRLHAAGRASRRKGWIPAHTDYVPFVVLATGRTGSTMVVSLLQSHPHCLCYSELYHSHHPMWFYDHMEYLNSPDTMAVWRGDVDGFLDDYVYHEQPPRVRAVGFKLLYCDLDPAAGFRRREEPWREDIVPALVRRGVRVVHVRRRNLLARHVSMKKADRDRVWVATSDDGAEVAASRPALELDIAECLGALEAAERTEAEYAARFAGLPVHDVYYEDVLEDRDAVLADLQGFLGLPPAPLKAATQKLRRRPLADEVANYDDIARALGGTSYERFLG